VNISKDIYKSGASEAREKLISFVLEQNEPIVVQAKYYKPLFSCLSFNTNFYNKP
jgi:hypothetical protein